MTATKMIAAALILPALILTAVTAATIWILHKRRAHEARGPAGARRRHDR
jgi:hypothetical protein